MKRKSPTAAIVLVLILSLLFLFGAVAGLIVSNATFVKLSEENTTEYPATIKNIEKEGSGTEAVGTIYTEEYGDKFFWFGYIDINDLNSLKTGQTISFGIENIWAEHFEETPFFHVVSLKTAEKEILTLRSSNEQNEHANFRITITGIIFGPIFLLVSIHCILLLKGINVFRRKNKTYGNFYDNSLPPPV